jgi:chemotaxis signal transduction protein
MSLDLSAMSEDYLGFLVGPYRCLMAVSAVHEVLETEGHVWSGQSHYEWRDQVLRVITLRSIMQLDDSNQVQHVGIVYSTGEEYLLLEVDKIVGLSADTGHFFAMPKIRDSVLPQLFDAVYCDDQQRQWLIWHLPLPVLLMNSILEENLVLDRVS